MKKQLIRSGVFETNSSSSHSISIANDTKEFILDTIYPDTEGNILLCGADFGWQWFKHNDAKTKAAYAAVAFQWNESLMEMLYKIIKEMTGANEVTFDGEGHIDHDSVGVCPSDYDQLKNFIFNKNSWLFGGK